MLADAIINAEELSQPQCIVIVDASGEFLAEVRMTGAKFLSRGSAPAKALNAASIGAQSDTIPETVRQADTAATKGCVTGLPGGLLFKVDNVLLGGIDVGLGSPEQDFAVAIAGHVVIGVDV